MTFFGLTTGGENITTDAIAREEMKHLLAALTVPNRLALELSMATGLRISDALSLTRAELDKAAKTGYVTVTESKTKKRKRIYIPTELYERMAYICGKNYVFEHRLDCRRHRTRQAVFKDLKRVAVAFRLPENIAPHSCRKIYAVNFYHKTGDIYRVQHLLNHSNEGVTMLYALADQLTARRLKRKRRKTTEQKRAAERGKKA